MNKNSISRRNILQGMVLGVGVIGFDLVSSSWVTSASSGSIAYTPQIDGEFLTEEAILEAVADDYGHIISKRPVAVLKPASVEDIIKIIKFAFRNKIKVAARGQAHSLYGQSQVEAGIVIDTSTLNQIHSITSDRAEVDAWVLWSELLKATLEQGLTPPVFTDYVELSVGGTLSVGGIGGTSYLNGVQVDNVLSLEVVTGKGRLKTCSREQNKDLFEAALAGVGQCCIIVKATIKLIRALEEARVFSLFYDDLTTFIRDQRLLVDDERFSFLEGQVIADDNGGWRYLLEVASFYNQDTPPDNNTLLRGLNYIPDTQQIEDKSYFDFINRLAPLVEQLKSIGVWSFPHPWLDLFVPNSAVESFVGGVVADLTLDDTGQGPVLLYPVKTKRFGLPLFRVPQEEIVFLFAILRTAVPPEDAVVERMVADNRRLFEQNRQLGGDFYPIDAVPLTRKDWKQHFRPYWGKLVRAKRRYDPKKLLTPGLGIF